MNDSKKIEIHHAEIGRDFSVSMGNEREQDDFELGRTDTVRYDQLDPARIAELWQRIVGREPTMADSAQVRDRLLAGQLIWKNDRDQFFATHLGVMLLFREPGVLIPQARISVEAYLQRHDEPLPTTPDDFLETDEPLPQAIASAVAFIRRNTRHSFRIEGISRLEVTEYPEEAVREALVNAVVHRDYERRGEPVRVKVFREDCITIRSPGGLVEGLTVSKLSRGRYDARSRNPLLASYLVKFNLMEQRGRGFQLMIEKMSSHGLQNPVLKLDGDWFEVSLMGPGASLADVKTARVIWGISDDIRMKLNERQEQIVSHVLEEGSVTTGWCMEQMEVARDTAHRYISELVKLDILLKKGRGRSTHYVLSPRAPE